MADLEELMLDTREAVARYRGGQREAVAAALYAGGLLNQAKARLQHGEWGGWVKRVGLNPRTATTWMRLADLGLTEDDVIARGGINAAISSGKTAHMGDKHPQASGSVYVLSNPAMDGYIKIGRTDAGTVASVVQRMRTLKSTGVPLPFECEHASAVTDPVVVEKTLHEAFGDYRVSPKSEFFVDLPAHRITVMLRLVEIEDVTPRSGQADESGDEPIRTSHKATFRFDSVGIPKGAVLQWADDPEKVCTVADEKTYVNYEGRRWAISTLARELKGWKRTPAGPEYWLYEGETLRERQRRLEGAEEE